MLIQVKVITPVSVVTMLRVAGTVSGRYRYTLAFLLSRHLPLAITRSRLLLMIE